MPTKPSPNGRPFKSLAQLAYEANGKPYTFGPWPPSSKLVVQVFERIANVLAARLKYLSNHQPRRVQPSRVVRATRRQPGASRSAT